MDNEELIAQLKLLLEDYVQSLGFLLVDIVCRYEGRNLVLKIFADKPSGGINMDECAILNREIGNLLDERGVIENRYILEVSSPGLDRPLKTKQDFLRFINKEVRFFLNDYINGKLEWEGLIDRVGQESVFIKTESGFLEIPFLRINKANLLI